MKTTEFKTGRALVLLVAGLLATAGVMAEKPEWAGDAKPGKPGQSQKQARPGQSQQGKAQGAPVQGGGYFGDDHRTVVRNYYSEQYRVGRCPPGLAKKNNGCMPPGQARKWTVGQPLPHDVIYYSVPPALVVQLGVPPAGHRYVRVGADILLIAIGTSMVIDALQDLNRM
jgi:Ni/Co efflux regulator RcnB